MLTSGMQTGALGLALVAATAAAVPDEGPVHLGWLPVDDVSIEALEQDGLQDTAPAARCAVRAAHELAELSVAYRYYGDLGIEDLSRIPFALSCSELVYYAYASCGVALGPVHQRTRALAFQPGVYAPAMVRLPPETPPLPGDLLVYHRDQESVEREVASRGWARPGHVVMVVHPGKYLVIGAHGSESTPREALTGVGYRLLPEQFARWTSGRSLVAVYRLAPPEAEVVLATATATVSGPSDLDPAP
jgi:hypothetical protein